MSDKKRKLVFVTGAGRGIGRTIALKLSEAGYSVSGCARSLNELEETKNLSGGKIHIIQLDVTDTVKMRKWMEETASIVDADAYGLVTAAGIYGPIGTFLENSWEHWKESVEINLYGTAQACRIFAQSVIAKNQPGRIILMSGGGATQPLPRFTSYCATKAAVVRFGETIAHELKEFNITVNAIAPGAVNTKLTDELIQAGPEKAGKEVYEKALKQKEEGGANPDKAGDLAVYLLSEKSSLVTGRLISAIWDPWQKMDEFGPQFEKSDVFTIRRITMEDRPKVFEK